ncbi:MAG: hypothetical protein WD361_03740 [Gracilimonas sp.]
MKRIKKRGYQITLSFILLLISGNLFGQSTIPKEYRGDSDYILRDVIDANNITTNLRNHGEMARWNDIPWGQWKEGRHIDGIGFVVSGQVTGERSKWPQFYGESAQDTLLNPVIILYRSAGTRISPYDGSIWGWLPLGEFQNQSRVTTQPGPNVLIARSSDSTTWPDQWPDKLVDESDPGWGGSWNGVLGKGKRIAGDELFYVMDDASDREYQIRKDHSGNKYANSDHGIYYPSASDSTLGGMGLQIEVRHLAWEHAEAEDILISHYRITNVSEKPLDKLWSTLIIDFGLGADESDDNVAYDSTYSMIYAWDSDGIGSNYQGDNYELGYVGFVVLEGTLSGFDLNTRPYYESGDNLRSDTWLFERIQENLFSNPDYKLPPTTVNEPFALITSGDFNLERMKKSCIKMLSMRRMNSTLLDFNQPV